MQNVKVHVHYEKWTAFIGFTVWYPRLPITLWLRDPVLNSISGWPITVWKILQGERQHKGAAKQFACGNRFQQTELRVFASFQVSDERTGERMYLSGHRDIMFDVTSLAADSIVSADRSIATIRNYKNRVIVQAVQPGETRIVIKAQTPNIDFGSTTLVVSAETVTVTRLTALPIVEMNINIEPTAGKRAQYDVVTTLETTFQHRYQHGSFFYQLYYSDDSMEFLDDVTVTDFTLTSQSSDERVIALAHKVQNGIDMIALDDLSDPYIQLELRPPVHCTDTDVAPLVMLQVPLRVQFDGVDSSRLAAARFSTNATTPTQAPETTSVWRMDSVLALILVLILFGIVIKFFSKRATSFRGYEKLVAPLLSRLSSSSSGGGRDEDSKEWVWLGKARTDTNSIVNATLRLALFSEVHHTRRRAVVTVLRREHPNQHLLSRFGDQRVHIADAGRHCTCGLRAAVRGQLAVERQGEDPGRSSCSHRFVVGPQPRQGGCQKRLMEGRERMAKQYMEF
ncbi:hypothetical protein OSTOST_13379 [Ostertagia ostertagi]